jgi:hypothetical protein
MMRNVNMMRLRRLSKDLMMIMIMMRRIWIMMDMMEMRIITRVAAIRSGITRTGRARIIIRVRRRRISWSGVIDWLPIVI